MMYCFAKNDPFIAIGTQFHFQTFVGYWCIKNGVEFSLNLNPNNISYTGVLSCVEIVSAEK